MPTLKQKFLGGAAFLTLLDASGALAASPLMPSWTGFYVGAHAGYSWGSVDGDTTRTVVIPPASAPNFWVNTPNPVPFVFERDINPKGWLGGFQAGYNFQAGRIVYGVETDFTWTGQSDSIFLSGDTRPSNFNTEDFSYNETTTAKLKYMGTLCGRLGYTVDQFLPYVTGGFAWGRMSMDTNWLLHQFNQVANLPFAGSEIAYALWLDARRRFRICIRRTLVHESRISVCRSRQGSLFRRRSGRRLFRDAGPYRPLRDQFPALICVTNERIVDAPFLRGWTHLATPCKNMDDK